MTATRWRAALVGAVILASSLVEGPASAHPATSPDLSGQATTPMMFSKVSGHIKRPMLVIFVQFDDQHTADALTDAAISARFFGTTWGTPALPSASAYVKAASGGDSDLMPAMERSDHLNPAGVANDGVVIVNGGNRPADVNNDAFQSSLIADAISRAGAAIDFSVFDTLDARGRVTPDANHDGRPDGDGQLTDFELVVDVMREATNVDENGGVRPLYGVGVGTLNGKSTAALSGVLTTSASNVMTHLHEIFHAAFGMTHPPGVYRGENRDVMAGTMSREEIFFLPSGYARYRLGWSTPEFVTRDGYQSLATPKLLLDPGVDQYTLVEQRIPYAGTADQNASVFGAVAWFTNPDYPVTDTQDSVVSEGASKVPLFRAGQPTATRSLYNTTFDGAQVWSYFDLPGPGVDTKSGLSGQMALLESGTNALPITAHNTSDDARSFGLRVTGSAPTSPTNVAFGLGQTKPVTLNLPGETALLRSPVQVMATTTGVTGDLVAGRPMNVVRATDLDEYFLGNVALRATTPGPFDARVFDPASGVTSTSEDRVATRNGRGLTTPTDRDFVDVERPSVNSAIDAAGDCGVVRANGQFGPVDVVLTASLTGSVVPSSEVPPGETWTLGSRSVPIDNSGAFLEQLCPRGPNAGNPSPVSARLGDRAAPRTLGMNYGVNFRYRVAAQSIPVQASFLHGLTHADTKQVFSAPCRGGFFPYCSGRISSVNTLAHPFTPGRACEADGCPDFAVFEWKGGPFDVVTASAAPVSLKLRNAIGDVVNVGRPFGINGGGPDTGGPRRGFSGPADPFQRDIPRRSFNDLRMSVADLPAGFYAMEIDGPATELTIDTLAQVLDTDLDDVPDATDICQFTADTDQSDIDGDGVGDACDARVATVTSVTTSPQPAYVGDRVVATAAVAGPGIDGGPVQFSVDGADVGPLVNAGPDGKATLDLGQLPFGAHSVKAEYLGDRLHDRSAGILRMDVSKLPTYMRAEAVVLDTTSRVLVTVGSVNASLFDQRSGAPLSGRQVRFTSGGGLICNAVTDGSGRARCLGVAPWTTAVLGLGFDATFAGDPTYVGSSNHGALTRTR
jgi:hypothetical protein